MSQEIERYCDTFEGSAQAIIDTGILSELTVSILSLSLGNGAPLRLPVNSEILKLHGVYQIRCTVNDRIYIGSASGKGGFGYRLNKHIYRLNNKTHHNWKLYRDWVRYGRSAFEFSILETCDRDNCVEREQYWFEYFEALGVERYNINPHASSRLGAVIREETKQKLREANLGKKWNPDAILKRSASVRGSKRSPETIARMKAAQKGKVVTDAMRDNMSKAHEIYDYIAVSPSGEAYETKNMERFCKEHGLSAVCMRKVARGISAYFKGWNCYYADPELRAKHPPKTTDRRFRQWLIISPDGKEFRLTNLTQFCKEHGLQQTKMSAVAKGQRTHHKGWKCFQVNKEE